MRTLNLTTRPAIQGSPFPGTVIDVAVLREIVSRPLGGSNGVNLEEMRRGIQVLDALDVADVTGEARLEDAQWEFLCARVSNFQWSVSDPRFVALCDAVLNAKEGA